MVSMNNGPEASFGQATARKSVVGSSEHVIVYAVTKAWAPVSHSPQSRLAAVFLIISVWGFISILESMPVCIIITCCTVAISSQFCSYSDVGVIGRSREAV